MNINLYVANQRTTWDKPRRIYFTFGGAAFDKTTEVIARNSRFLGADDVWVFDDRWLIESGFVNRNAWLWEAQPQHGFGHCSWKAFVWQKAMEKAKPGDLLLYTDADTFPIADISPLFDLCEEKGQVIFEEQGCENNRYIKRDCFIAMGLDFHQYHFGKHGCGRFQLFKKGPFLNHQLLSEWAAYSVNPRCTLHDRSILGEDLPDFTRNSTEQAVLTLLAHKYELKLHRTPDQNGWPIAPDRAWCQYPQIFQQVWCDGDRSDVNGSRFFTETRLGHAEELAAVLPDGTL